MESIFCVNIPIQMISCTDTNGKITPIRFRFFDNTGELITVKIDKILSTDQNENRIGANFCCTALIHGSQRRFTLWYNYFAHEWRLSHLK